VTAGGAPSSITLHSSWRGIVGGFAGSGIVLVVGAVAVAQVGWLPVPTIVAVIGAGLFAVVVFDFPIASTFGAEGVTRRPLGRRHLLRYEDIVQLTRTRPKVVGKTKTGGLVAAVGRRRYLLVDQPESRDEFQVLHELLERAAPGLADLDLSPPADVNPTWIYRRKRWGGATPGR